MPMDYTTDLSQSPTTRGMSPSLTNQTPGLDAGREARDFALRQWSWLKENQGLTLGILGGLCAIGIGTWLLVRSRQPTRLEMLRDKGSDLVDWIRAKLE